MSNTVCMNCKEIITSVVDHEFCHYSKYPKPQPDTEPEIYYGQPPHRPKKEHMPRQKPINHSLAPLGAAPPTLAKHTEYGGFDDIRDDSRQDLARNIMEEKS